MGVGTLNPTDYGRLCADVIPKVIESDAEFDRLIAKMEESDRKPSPTPEEEALSALLMKLIQDSDDRRYPLPTVLPHRMLQYLVKQRD